MAATKSAPRIADKDVQALVRRFKKGYTVEADGKSKFRVVGPDGEVVRRKSGTPMTLSGSMDARYTADLGKLEKQLVELGVIGEEQKSNGHVEENPELVAAVQDARSTLNERMAKLADLKQRMTPWINKIGGWNAYGLQVDMALMMTARGTENVELETHQKQMSQFVNGSSQVFEPTLEVLEKIHEEFSNVDDPRTLWFDTVRELRGIEAPTPVRSIRREEWPFEVKLLRLDDLFADEAYQRPPHEQFIRELALKFDERLVGAIDVSDRGKNNYAILDGQQRYEAMKLIGKSACWAAVYMGMTLEDEASHFFHKNRDRKAIHPWYHFRAKLVAGDETMQGIQKILDQHGFELAIGARGYPVITAIRAVEYAHAYHSNTREECLSPTLELIRNLWAGREKATDGDIIRGLSRFFATYHDDEIIWEHLNPLLSELGPTLIIGRANDLRYGTSNRSAGAMGRRLARVLGDIHNTGLPRGQRLNLDRINDVLSR